MSLSLCSDAPRRLSFKVVYNALLLNNLTTRYSLLAMSTIVLKKATGMVETKVMNIHIIRRFNHALCRPAALACQVFAYS